MKNINDLDLSQAPGITAYHLSQTHLWIAWTRNELAIPVRRASSPNLFRDTFVDRMQLLLDVLVDDGWPHDGT